MTKPGLTPSFWDEILHLGESRGGTPTGVRAPLSARRAQARRLDLRLSACCLAFFSREEKSKWRVVDSEADFSHSHLALDQTPTRIALRERHPLCALAIAVADRDLTRPVPAAKNSETTGKNHDGRTQTRCLRRSARLAAGARWRRRIARDRCRGRLEYRAW